MQVDKACITGRRLRLLPKPVILACGWRPFTSRLHLLMEASCLDFPIARRLVYLIVIVVEEKPRYAIRPSSESTLALKIFRKGLLAGERHVLFFERYAGEIQYDQEDHERSYMRFVVESRSVTCKDDWLSRKQRNKVVSYTLNKMLVAERFPLIEFTSTAVTRTSAHRYDVRGDLTIRGMTRSVFIQVTARQIGTELLEFDGEMKVRMKDYGMKPPTAVFGFAGTKNKMTLHFLFWAKRLKADVPLED